MIHELEREQWISRPLERVFPFFERPENLALITPTWLGFRLLSAPPVRVFEGCFIDYKIRVKGIPVRWRTLISAYDPPRCFVDEQVRGPYAYWQHLHRFEADGDRTRIRDRVRYALPQALPGPVEGLVHGGFVRPALIQIFDYRAGMFDRLFGSNRHPKRDRSIEI